jgi:hypothetical protein
VIDADCGQKEANAATYGIGHLHAKLVHLNVGVGRVVEGVRRVCGTDL